MIKVAICDDDEKVCIDLMNIIKSYFSKAQRTAWVTKFSCGNELLKSNIRFDIIFLDIEMPELNGIETAEKLRIGDVNSKIIYVTNYEKYKGHVYKVHPFDYVGKPISETTIRGVLEEAIRYYDNAIEKKKYAFTTDSGIIIIELDDIYYFEYLSRRVKIYTSKGEYSTMYSLKELYEKFRVYNFESPHKSFIINMLHIKYIKGFDIFIENGDTIPLAQKRAVKFKEIFNDFMQSTFDRI